MSASWRQSIRWGAAALALAAWPVGMAHGGDGERPKVEDIQALLATGKAQDALAMAQLALEYAPADLALLSVGSQAAEAAEDLDLSLWLARIALDHGHAAGAKKAQVAALELRVAGLDPLPEEQRRALADGRRTAFELARLCASKKLYANAVDLFGRLEGTALATAAETELAKIYKSKAAVQSLVDSGVNVPLRHKEKRSAEWIARNDAKHHAFKDAWRVKTENYTVVTNMGYELANSMARAMEQMNRHYRKVFKHKEHGGGTGRCTLRVYRTFDEYKAAVSADMHDALGFFQPGENAVSTYDPRPTFAISELWTTLYHEASHQFTSMIFAGTAPSWLDEGTASYCEGARLLPNGRVETNLIVDSYLNPLLDIFKSGEPSLRQVVSWNRPDSYPVDYYPGGWGLVYFFLNYEDENSERVYAPHYEAYMKTYRSGGKHDVMERFLEHFVRKPKQPGIESFEDLEERFCAWIRELAAIHQGPPSKANDLIERGRTQRKNGKLDAAVESYTWALRKDPGHLEALRDLAALRLDRKEPDAALACLRELAERAGRLGPDESAIEDETVNDVVAACDAGAVRVNKLIGARLAEFRTGVAASVLGAADGYAAKGRPRSAVRLLDGASVLLGRPAAIVDRRAAIADESGVDVRRRRRLPVDDPLIAWEGTGESKGTGTAIAVESQGMASLEYRADLPRSYRFEASFHPAAIGKDTYCAILFGRGSDGVWDIFGLDGDGEMTVQRLKNEWDLLADAGSVPPADVTGCRLAIDVDGGDVRFLANGKEVARRMYSDAALAGRVGLVFGGGAFEIRDVVLTY